MSVTARGYAGEDDYGMIRQLLEEMYRLSGPPDYATVGDIDWWRATDEDPDAIRSSRLWFDDSGTLVGFAWLSGDTVDLFSLPAYRYIENEMLDWAETRITGASEPSDDDYLNIFAFSNDESRRDILRRKGYERSDALHNYRSMRLGDVPVPVLPNGYTIRNVEGEVDLEQRVAVHRNAFAPSRMTVEKHQRVMASATYQPGLDLIAVAPDGAFAAYCIVWYDEANRNGVFEPVGCHSEHRKRGLASAVMLEGMRRVQQRGAASVCVVSDGYDEAANRLYDSLGFTLIDQNEGWRKRLRG
jgi:ribosomal protein S18 acetylase RimI-like enzyme